METPSIRASLQIVRISAGPRDRFRLTDPYVEEVWSEFLGPTATLLARRLGRTIEVRPDGAELDIGDLAASVGVPPTVALRSLRRLHRFEVVHSDLERGVVGVSGFAAPVSGKRVSRLSESGRSMHEQLMTDGIATPTIGERRVWTVISNSPEILGHD
jgi:hypothetical protein